MRKCIASHQSMYVLATAVLALCQSVWADYMLVAARSEPTTGGFNPVLRFRFQGTGPLTPISDIPSTLLDDPSFPAFSPSGELFVSNRYLGEWGHGDISRFTFDTSGNFTAGERITGNGLEIPIGLAVSPWGELFASNGYSGTISRFTFAPAGQAVPNGTIATGRTFGLGLAFTASGDLLSAHGWGGVQRFTFDPVTRAVVSSEAVPIPGLYDATGLALNSHGELFVADIGGLVYRVNFDSEENPVPNGTIVVGDGPVGVAFSPEDELFVTSHFSGGISRFIFDDLGNAIPNGYIATDHLAGVAVGVYPTVVPAPGAILLGTIGAGLVGWLRRRRTL